MTSWHLCLGWENWGVGKLGEAIGCMIQMTGKVERKISDLCYKFCYILAQIWDIQTTNASNLGGIPLSWEIWDIQSILFRVYANNYLKHLGGLVLDF